MKRMSERALKQYIRSSTNINGIFAAQDALAYRCALRKVVALSKYGNGVTPDMCISAIRRCIDRALGAKR